MARLERINAETERRKELDDAEELYDLFHALGALPPPRSRGRSGSPPARASSASRSPTSRARAPRSASPGAPVERLCSVAEPADRHALRISAISCGGNVGIGLCTDPEAVEGVARAGRGRSTSRSSSSRSPAAVSVPGGGAEARHQPRLLGDRPAGRRGGRGRARGRGRGFDSVWVAESYGSDVRLGARLARGADRDDQARRGDHAGPGAPAGRRGDGGGDDRRALGRALHLRLRPLGAAGLRGLVRRRRTRSPGAGPASTSRSCARSSPARGRSSTRASTTSCRSRAGTGQGKALKLNFHPLRNEIPVFVGAIGRKSVEMAAEICDGWIPIFFSADAFEETWGEHLEAGFAKGGRTREDLEISPSLSGRDRRRPRRGARRGQGGPAALPRRHGLAARPTSTSTSPTASASARSPTRSSRCTSTASARRPTTRSPTSSSTRPRWSAARRRSPSGSSGSPRPASTG